MEHLTFEKARKEITVFNALIRAEVIKSDNQQSIDRAIGEGIDDLQERRL